jgi:hypothetical protein
MRFARRHDARRSRASPSTSPGSPRALSNTALHIGAALGVAITTTIAVSRSDYSLSANQASIHSPCSTKASSSPS